MPSRAIPSSWKLLFPIVLNDRIVVPAGSYVQGEILEAKRPGKVKGQGEVRIRLTTMILPNGYTVKFDAVPTKPGTGGNESTDTRSRSKETPINRATRHGAEEHGIGAGIGGIAGRSGQAQASAQRQERQRDWP